MLSLLLSNKPCEFSTLLFQDRSVFLCVCVCECTQIKTTGSISISTSVIQKLYCSYIAQRLMNFLKRQLLK